MVTKRPTRSTRDAAHRTIIRPEAKDGKRRLTSVSLVVPTRNEAGNIKELVARIERACSGISAEIVFVDDSTDDTPEVVRDVSQSSCIPIVLIHRPPEQRKNGLGGAVVEGIRAATGEWVCVMDADLQHPPELIPKLLQSARDEGSDIVVASRYMQSGDAGGLSALRRATSKAFTFATRLFFPRRLRNVSDPLSGYFLVRRQALDPDRLRPRGFKILLELLVRTPLLNVSEVPFSFQTRYSGDTKASPREGLRYLALLLNLRLTGLSLRLTRFGMVGASGLVVNLLLLAVFTNMAGIHYVLSAALATQGSTLWNFALTEGWVFRERAGSQRRLSRLGRFLLMNNGTLLMRGPFLVILTSGLGVHYLISNLITLLALGLSRYAVSDGWIWAESLYQSRQKWFNYDIHGIVRVASEVRLPELEYFHSPDMSETPDVRVRVGSLRSSATESPEQTGDGDGHFRYRESLGRVGFWVEISRGKIMDVVASPLLRRSPHVLYTNVVEPILRWTLVQKGCALVHGACVARHGKAVLITAETDTGKTTTILRLLSKVRASFLSDDMVIVRRNGRVLCYPKPLTISRHTLEAVNGAPLSRLERIALQVQSRLHSKSGRQSALTLARMPLPMATINTIVQMLVPPPKYTIQRLIPGVEGQREALMSHMVVIERGPDQRLPLDPAQALTTLLKNCEDAYGFPPYPALERFLPIRSGADLHGLEREIIGDALGGCDTTLIRSQNRNWWLELPRILDGFGANDTGLTATKTAAGDTPAEELLERPSPMDGTSKETSQSS